MKDVEQEISKIKNEMLDKIINNNHNMDGFLKDIDDIRRKDPALHSTLVSMYSAYKIELDELKNNNLVAVAKIADLQLSMIRKVGVEISKINKPNILEIINNLPKMAKTFLTATTLVIVVAGLYATLPSLFGNVKDFLFKLFS